MPEPIQEQAMTTRISLSFNNEDLLQAIIMMKDKKFEKLQVELNAVKLNAQLASRQHKTLIETLRGDCAVLETKYEETNITLNSIKTKYEDLEVLREIDTRNAQVKIEEGRLIISKLESNVKQRISDALQLQREQHKAEELSFQTKLDVKDGLIQQYLKDKDELEQRFTNFADDLEIIKLGTQIDQNSVELAFDNLKMGLDREMNMIVEQKNNEIKSLRLNEAALIADKDSANTTVRNLSLELNQRIKVIGDLKLSENTCILILT
jgi:hypothetical protein